MSNVGAGPESMRSYLNDAFYGYEKKYGVEVRPQASLAVRFLNIIQTAFVKTGQQMCILIDEYDSPLQHSWKSPLLGALNLGIACCRAPFSSACRPR